MALKRIAAPDREPVTLTEAKRHLRVDGNEEDGDIESLIITAREYCEGYQNRAYVSQTWEYILDQYPDYKFEIPKPPLQSVISIKYTDTESVERTVPASDYIVDTDSFKGRVVLGFGKQWPTVILQPINGFRVRFVCGYGAPADVPMKVKQAMKLLIGYWYANREAAATGTVSAEVEFSVHALLKQERVAPV